MQMRWLVVVAVLAVWGFLIYVAVSPNALEWAERLSLQEPGRYPVMDSEDTVRFVEGQPYVTDYVRLIQYMLVTLAVGLFAWRFMLDKGGRV